MKRRFGCVQPSRIPAFVSIALFLATMRPGVVFATTCTDVCPGTGSCTIGSARVVDADSVLDCSGRDITIGNAGSLKVIGGDLALLADDLLLNGSGSLIHAVEGPDDRVGTIDIQLTGSLGLRGKIRANGDHGGGSIQITTAGNIVVYENGTDGIEADGISPNADGGDVTLDAGGMIQVFDPVHAEGNTSGESGGGTIDIHAVGNITVAYDGHLSASGKTAGGGRVVLESETGDVTISEHIDVDGKGPTGDGGLIEITAHDTIAVGEQLYARGGINAGGGTASGGNVLLESGCGGISINASIFVTGGQLGTGEDGGSIEADSAGSITVANGVVLDTHALASGGDGGSVSLTARDLVTLTSGSTIDSRGSATAPGRGGDVALRGCRLNVQSSATVDTTAYRGGTVSASATMAPPTTGTQPLIISGSAVLKAAGGSSSEAGRIAVAPLTTQKGQCDNNSALPCVVDLDCVVGCQTGQCLYANPDLAGVVTQFDVTPVTYADRSLGECQASCN